MARKGVGRCLGLSCWCRNRRCARVVLVAGRRRWPSSGRSSSRRTSAQCPAASVRLRENVKAARRPSLSLFESHLVTARLFIFFRTPARRHFRRAFFPRQFRASTHALRQLAAAYAILLYYPFFSSVHGVSVIFACRTSVDPIDSLIDFHPDEGTCLFGCRHGQALSSYCSNTC